MNIGESVFSSEGALKVTLIAFDQKTGAGRVWIDELLPDRGRFFVTVKYGPGGQMRIDYKSFDVYKMPGFGFNANPGEAVTAIEIVQVSAD